MRVLSELWNDSNGISLPDVNATSCLAVEEEKHLFLSKFTVHDSGLFMRSVYPCPYPCVNECVWVCDLVMWNMMTDYLTGRGWVFMQTNVPRLSCFTVPVQVTHRISFYRMTEWPIKTVSSKFLVCCQSSWMGSGNILLFTMSRTLNSVISHLFCLIHWCLKDNIYMFMDSL